MTSLQGSEARSSTTLKGLRWCLNNPDALIACHLDGRIFIAIHPDHGIVRSADDEESFEARLNDLRPSVLQKLWTTCTSLWVQAVDENGRSRHANEVNG